MPFLSEAVYRNLVVSQRRDAPPSVHMAGWPEHRPGRIEYSLLTDMEVVQRVVALGRAARNEAGISEWLREFRIMYIM